MLHAHYAGTAAAGDVQQSDGSIIARWRFAHAPHAFAFAALWVVAAASSAGTAAAAAAVAGAAAAAAMAVLVSSAAAEILPAFTLRPVSTLLKTSHQQQHGMRPAADCATNRRVREGKAASSADACGRLAALRQACIRMEQHIPLQYPPFRSALRSA
eukprot:TRINITY_DN5796_c1_g1_i1.p1 TRINITY_DN5796_c1_g1~~TRINITY_DN5796_c1_g1_i1.p1  ORF type:complete len:157 (+),score=30.28 TRINITY_DN5796_c1_g1_i1:135-605(+)